MDENWVLYYYDPSDDSNNMVSKDTYITAVEALSGLDIDQINGSDGVGYFALNIKTEERLYPNSTVLY